VEKKSGVTLWLKKLKLHVGPNFKDFLKHVLSDYLPNTLSTISLRKTTLREKDMVTGRRYE
jgi:hypothetical protein